MEYTLLVYTIFLYIWVIVIGSIILFVPKLRKKIDLDDIFRLFLLTAFLRIFDVLSTIYFVSKIGIENEFNEVARLSMSNIGIIPGMILVYIIALPVSFFLYVVVYKILDKGLAWKIFKIGAITVSAIVPFWNIYSVI